VELNDTSPTGAAKLGAAPLSIRGVPTGWVTKTIGQCLTIKHGKSQHEVACESGSYPIYGTGGVIGRASAPLYCKPSVLIGRKGTIDSPRFLDTPFWSVDTLFYSEVNNDTDAKLMYYQFCMINWYSYNEASGVPSLNARTIEKIEISIPTLIAEQEAIANALSDADSLVELLEQLLTKKRQIKQGAMQELLTGRRRLPGFRTTDGFQQTEIGLIPRDWDMVLLKDVSDCFVGLTYSPQDVRSAGTLVLRSSNIQENRLKFFDNVFVDMPLPDRVITQKGDILICVRNGSRQLIGKCALIDQATAGSAFGAFMGLLRGPSNAFLFQQFQSTKMKTQIRDGMGATINQITNKDMAAFRVAWPQLETERNEIASVLFEMDDETANVEAKLVKARQIKQGMMQELLTGRIRLL
jgi:type I restriction enzyme, S subunit